MSIRYLKLLCTALFICVGVKAQNRAVQNTKGENRLAINPETPILIESMDGADLYKAYCATCHGTDGKGLGPMTRWLKITAPDLTRISMRNGSMFPLARVQRIISGKESTTQGHGNREMPVWGPVFSQVSRDQDLGRMRVYNLAKFIEKMQTN
jgi:mono/diheme cytochrome c family protein